MTTNPEALERELVRDLESLAPRFADEEFSGDLYRALANTIWTKDDVPGHLDLSWKRSEELVNELRLRLAGEEPLELAQTGGEGDISRLVESELRPLGWSARPLPTGRHHPDHLT